MMRDLLTGRTPWGDANPGVRSMARKPIFDAACMIRDAPKARRLVMLEKIPESIRPHVRAEVERLFRDGIKSPK